MVGISDMDEIIVYAGWGCLSQVEMTIGVLTYGEQCVCVNVLNKPCSDDTLDEQVTFLFINRRTMACFCDFGSEPDDR